MMIFPEILRASDEVSGSIFCKLFHIYIQNLPGVYMSQMVNVFYMSFMCLYMFIYTGPCLLSMS